MAKRKHAIVARTMKHTSGTRTQHFAVHVPAIMAFFLLLCSTSNTNTNNNSYFSFLPVAEASTSMDAATLRSLGMSPQEIDSLLGEKGNDDDDNVEEEGLWALENADEAIDSDSYEEYDDTDDYEDDVTEVEAMDAILNNEEEGEDLFLMPEEAIEDEFDTDVAMEQSELDSEFESEESADDQLELQSESQSQQKGEEGEWWKDPFARFGKDSEDDANQEYNKDVDNESDVDVDDEEQEEKEDLNKIAEENFMDMNVDEPEELEIDGDDIQEDPNEILGLEEEDVIDIGDDDEYEDYDAYDSDDVDAEAGIDTDVNDDIEANVDVDADANLGADVGSIDDDVEEDASLDDVEEDANSDAENDAASAGENDEIEEQSESELEPPVLDTAPDDPITAISEEKVSSPKADLQRKSKTIANRKTSTNKKSLVPPKEEPGRGKGQGQLTNLRKTPSPPSIPVGALPMVLPAIGKTLMQSPVAVQIFALGAVGNIAFQRLGWMNWTRKGKGKKARGEDGGSSSDYSSTAGTTIDMTTVGNVNSAEEMYEVDSEFDESDYVEENYGGFGRPRSRRSGGGSAASSAGASVSSSVNTSARQEYENYSDEDESGDWEEEVVPEHAPKRKQKETKKKNGGKRSFWGRRKGKADGERMGSAASGSDTVYSTELDEASTIVTTAGAKKQFSLFRGRQTMELEVSKLHDQVEALTQRARASESVREQLESDCDTAMHQVSFTKCYSNCLVDDCTVLT